MPNDALAQSGRAPPDDVFNQVTPLGDVDLFSTDAALRDSLAREGAGLRESELRSIGTALGDARLAGLANLANRYPPTWQSFDPQGHRVDRIDFHPAWHELMEGIVSRGFHASPWERPDPHGHLVRAAGYLMQARVEQGSLCPTTMTYGAVPALSRDPWLAREWVPRIVSRHYDPRDLPVDRKRGALVGMGMTEKQGGSDVRANTTRALRTADGSYRLVGHKWFYSAPQCDAHLVLAYGIDGEGRDEGLGCYFVPRHRPDGGRNGVRVQRLKDKVGNRSNASSEVEFVDAWAHRLGDAGRGIPTILEMGTFTRLDCVIGTAGMMREAVVQAIHHARHRSTFGRLLVDQPLMHGVLADLAIESEAATALALRLARSFDRDDEAAIAFRRVMTSAAKFWICKRGPGLAAEAMEVLGGNGYVEEGPLARIYREMPVNSIWEGSGNIMCLDVLRALGRSPDTVDLLVAEWASVRGSDADFDAAADAFETDLRGRAIDEASARRLVQRLVTLVQGGLLLGSGSSEVAAAFCATRLSNHRHGGAVYGAVPIAASRAIIDRAWPG